VGLRLDGLAVTLFAKLFHPTIDRLKDKNFQLVPALWLILTRCPKIFQEHHFRRVIAIENKGSFPLNLNPIVESISSDGRNRRRHLDSASLQQEYGRERPSGGQGITDAEKEGSERCQRDE
jgi:hypothetical protein